VDGRQLSMGRETGAERAIVQKGKGFPRCWHRDFSGMGGKESERGGEGVAREAIAIGFLAMAEGVY